MPNASKYTAYRNMELTVMQIIDATLYFLIYGGSCFIILTVLLDLQTAWINHISNNINVADTSGIKKIVSAHKIEAQIKVETEVVEVVEIVAPIRKVAAPKRISTTEDKLPVSAATKSASKVRIEERRQRCNANQIQWKYARINPTGRKRHLTVKEMETALGI